MSFDISTVYIKAIFCLLENKPNILYIRSQTSIVVFYLIVKVENVNYINMSSSPTGCCAVQWATWKGVGLTSRDRLNRPGNYLLLGFLLARPSHSLLLLVRQFVT